MPTRRAAVVVALLGVVGLVVSITAVWPRQGPGPDVRESLPGPSAASAPATAGGPAGTDGAAPSSPAGPAVSRADAGLETSSASAAPRPVRAILGSVDVKAAVRPVGVAADRQMQLPPDPRVLGWYKFGPAPGATAGGSVVLAGHLDSRRFGLGPLVRLRQMQVGDDIEVVMSDGTTATYRVRDLQRYDRQALPEELFSRVGPERLRVITCGGAYDAEAGGYEENLVVTAVPA